MARIRTVKPELFKHEQLFDAEIETGLPLRLAFIGLFLICDREGRFKYRPRTIKTEIMPYDHQVDMSRVLHALATRGFLVVYAHSRELYACIPSFLRHQVINNKEKSSVLPDPGNAESEIINDFEVLLTRESRVSDATSTPLSLSQGEGKGREGKGKGKGKEVVVRERDDDAMGSGLRKRIWDSYRDSYVARYKTEPVRNAKINAQIKQLADRLGDEAPAVVQFYLNHNKTFYVSNLHPIGLCVSDAEALRTQWFHDKPITQVEIKQFERANANMALAEKIEKGEI